MSRKIIIISCLLHEIRFVDINDKWDRTAEDGRAIQTGKTSGDLWKVGERGKIKKNNLVHAKGKREKVTDS